MSKPLEITKLEARRLWLKDHGIVFTTDDGAMMGSSIEQRFLGSNGVTLVADMGGPIDAFAVILLHGGGQTRHSWSGTMKRLIEEGYRVINFDARGDGASGWAHNGDYSLAGFGNLSFGLADNVIR